MLPNRPKSLFRRQSNLVLMKKSQIPMIVEFASNGIVDSLIILLLFLYKTWHIGIAEVGLKVENWIWKTWKRRKIFVTISQALSLCRLCSFLTETRVRLDYLISASSVRTMPCSRVGEIISSSGTSVRRSFPLLKPHCGSTDLWSWLMI